VSVAPPSTLVKVISISSTACRKSSPHCLRELLIEGKATAHRLLTAASLPYKVAQFNRLVRSGVVRGKPFA
jgi:hypothetical protein